MQRRSRASTTPHVQECVPGRATPVARERNPPMGVVKRGLWAWRLFHFFNATESRYYGDAQSAHLPQCSATQASGPTRISRKDFALQSPSNPKRATRSGVEEKNGISAEGRAKRVMPNFFCAQRSVEPPEQLFKHSCYRQRCAPHARERIPSEECEDRVLGLDVLTKSGGGDRCPTLTLMDAGR